MADALPEDANIPTYFMTDDVDLITAAPDLLGACETLLAIVVSEYDELSSGNDASHWLPAIQGARLAIAKAEGESEKTHASPNL